MLNAGLIDRMMVFVAPKLLGGDGQGLFAGAGFANISGSLQLTDLHAVQVGHDVLLEGEVLNVHRPD